MKKFLSLLLTVVLLLTTFVPAFAADPTKAKIELKQAIEIAKEQLKIDTEGYNFNSSYSEDQEGRKYWYLSWEGMKGNNGTINVSVDADNGDITSFNTYTPANSYSKIPKYTREQALKAATDFAARMQPEKFKSTEILPQDELMSKIYPYYNDVYVFNFTRMVNGIPYVDNKISVNVDKNTLKVRDYSFIWDSKELPDASKAMSIEDAKKIFKEKLGVEASYNLVYTNYNEAPKAILVYTYVNGNKPIDAITGEVMNYSNYFPYYGMSEAKMLDRGSVTSVLTPEEDKNVQDTGKLISKEKALETVNKYLSIDSKYKNTSANLNNGYPKGSNPVWYFNWEYRNDDGSEYGYKGVSVDAVTGELKSFYQGGSEYDYKKDEKAKFSKEDSKAIAEEFLKKVQPEKFAMTVSRNFEDAYIDSRYQPTNYSFNYIKKVDNISYPFDTINASVNAYTGEIASYNMEWYEPAELPKAENILSLDDAYKSFFEKQNFSLKYIKYYDYSKDSIAKPELKLVYMMDNISSMADAKTGDLLDYSGKPIRLDDKVSFSDIEGHWAESQIYTLADMGIIGAESDKYLPNESVKQKDFIRMLVKTVQPAYGIRTSEDEYDTYYEQAVNSKIIFASERADEKAVSRIDAAKYIVRAMNLGYIADMGGVFAETFKDIKANDRNMGYASIAAGLKILNADNGYFKPANEVTRAETAVILVRFLKVDTTNKQ